MRQRLQSAFFRRPVFITGLALLAVVLTVALSAQAFAWARWELFALRIDRASSACPSPVDSHASWSFAFGDAAVRLSVPICADELDAAHDVDTRAMFNATAALRARYVAHVVRAQSRSPFVAALSRQLRAVRSDRALDDDQYLELVVRAVQSLRYGTVESRVRLPVEVVSSGFGVCSEKALLLAALMVHEGYQTGMWVFDSQNHVALAVGSDAAQFRGSGYAFIETTRNAYVGEYDVDYMASGPLARPPQFISFGAGRRYHAGAEVEYILSRLEVAKEQRDVLGPSRMRQVWLGRGRDADPVLTTRKQAARDLVSYIRGQTDDREAAFERLVRSAAEAAAEGPPALLR